MEEINTKISHDNITESETIRKKPIVIQEKWLYKNFVVCYVLHKR